MPPRASGRQAGALDVFVELPVSLRRFVEDPAFLGFPALSRIQAEAVERASCVYPAPLRRALAGMKSHPSDPAAAAYWRQSARSPMSNFVIMEWGKGSGKDATARLVVLRVAYLLLCLESPQAAYGMPGADSIHLLNVASSATQANRAFFTPLKRMVKSSPWFKGRAETVESLIRFDKNIEAVSGHSDAESQEGLNLLVGIADEIDAFARNSELAAFRGARPRESPRSAESILEMLQTSGASRFPETFKVVALSWPRYVGSMIETLVLRGRRAIDELGESSRHYVSGPCATWEVNPRVPDRSAFESEFREDPRLAAAKYECRPSRAASPYFSNDQAIRECIVSDEVPLRVGYKHENVSWEASFTFSANLRPVRGAAYALHFDLARNGDRAGVCMAHVSRWREIVRTGLDEQGREVMMTARVPVITEDFAVVFEADLRASPPREIQVRWARELAGELLRRGFNVRSLTADHYQSLDLLQSLAAQGIPTSRCSVDKDESIYKQLRDIFNEGRVEIHHYPLLLDELAGLTKLRSGRVDHASGSSKDLSDALAGAVQGAVLLGGEEDPSGAISYPGSQWDDLQATPLPAPIGAELAGGLPVGIPVGLAEVAGVFTDGIRPSPYGGARPRY
jgi:hypothetical protein